MADGGFAVTKDARRASADTCVQVEKATANRDGARGSRKVLGVVGRPDETLAESEWTCTNVRPRE